MRYFIFTTRGAAIRIEWAFRLKNAIQCYCSPLYMLLCAKYVLVVNALYIYHRRADADADTDADVVAAFCFLIRCC